jgi:hypothetical protein
VSHAPAYWLGVVARIEATLGRAAAVRAGRIIWWEKVSILPYREDHYGFAAILDEDIQVEVPKKVFRDALVMAGWKYHAAMKRAKGPKTNELQNPKNLGRLGARRRTTDVGRHKGHQEDSWPSTVGAFSTVPGQEQDFRSQMRVGW